MNKTALMHAWERLHQAQSALADLRKTESVADTERAWSKFIVAAGTVFSKLEKGSRGSTTSEAWFGRIKHERRNDPLLRYVHQARNVDEHGIKDVTRRKGQLRLQGSIRLSPLPGAPSSKPSERGMWITDIKGTNPDGSMDYSGWRVELVDVADDRYGDVFPVPDVHLGTKIIDASPLGIASLCEQYLKRIVGDAGKLI